MNTYRVHHAKKTEFYYAELTDVIQYLGSKCVKLDIVEIPFTDFYGYFDGFGAPANRVIILDDQIWRLGKYTSKGCYISNGIISKFLTRTGEIHTHNPNL
jgi:hypothetical protein